MRRRNFIAFSGTRLRGQLRHGRKNQPQACQNRLRRLSVLTSPLPLDIERVVARRHSPLGYLGLRRGNQ
jgi:hypothetical protein